MPGGDKKYGRNEAKCKKYALERVREKNKLRRVLRSEGEEAAARYADAKSLGGYLRGML